MQCSPSSFLQILMLAYSGRLLCKTYAGRTCRAGWLGSSKLTNMDVFTYQRSTSLMWPIMQAYQVTC